MALSITIFLALNKKNLMDFIPLTPEIMCLMFTYPKSTVRILRFAYANAFDFKPHDFATGGILPPWIFPPIGLRAPGGLTLDFAPNF